MNQKYYSLEEVSQLLQISLYSLRKKIRDKELKGYKFCKKYLVLEEDLREFIEKGKIG